MRRTQFGTRLAAVAAMALLGACGSLDVLSRKKAEPDAPTYEARAGLTAAERLLEARSFMNEGAYENAAIELRAATLTANARQLEDIDMFLAQIETDPLVFFASEGGRTFTHRVQSNESLAKIARDQLGDANLFVALARFNGIVKPGDISRGQRIVIPGQPRARAPEPARVAETTETASPAPVDALAAARSAMSGGDHLAALKTLQTTPSAGLSAEKSAERAKLLLDIQCKEADEREAADARITAAALVACAKPIAGRSDAESQLSALAMASDALGLDRNAGGAEAMASSLRLKLEDEAAQWVTEASAAFTSRDYVKAAALAEKVVLVEPDNSFARTLLDRARRNLQRQ